MDPKRYRLMLILVLLGWLFTVTLGMAASPMLDSAPDRDAEMLHKAMLGSDEAQLPEAIPCCETAATLTACELVCATSALQTAHKFPPASARTLLHVPFAGHWQSWLPDLQPPPPDVQSV